MTLLSSNRRNFPYTVNPLFPLILGNFGLVLDIEGNFPFPLFLEDVDIFSVVEDAI
jgi:hypothetical protein